MATKTEDITAIAERLDPAMQQAHQIIKQSWLDAGMTEEEWTQNRIKEEVLDRLVRPNLSWEEADAYLENTPWAEIQRKHRELYPGRYEIQ